nr:MAG TPA: hypothetical protein [Caudoviricetes sp.]
MRWGSLVSKSTRDRQVTPIQTAAKRLEKFFVL